MRAMTVQSLSPRASLAKPGASVPARRRVAAAVRAMITAGEIGPGEHLRELDLAGRLGVSRNTLREGFRELAGDGLVRHEPNRGVFVAAPTAEDVRRLYTARRILECGVLHEQARTHALSGPGVAAEVLDVTARALHAAERQEWRLVGDLNMDFHAAVVRLGGSAVLDAAAAPLLAHARLAFRSLDLPGALHAHFGETNRSLAETMRDGAWEQAAGDMRSYLLAAEAELLEGLG